MARGGGAAPAAADGTVDDGGGALKDCGALWVGKLKDSPEGLDIPGSAGSPVGCDIRRCTMIEDVALQFTCDA